MAIALDMRNPLARFELASVLMAQERLEDALHELQELSVSQCVCVLVVLWHCVWGLFDKGEADCCQLAPYAPALAGWLHCGLRQHNLQSSLCVSSFVSACRKHVLICVFVLQGIVPREAAVHIMMGRLHKRLRNPDAALTAFNIGKGAREA